MTKIEINVDDQVFAQYKRLAEVLGKDPVKPIEELVEDYITVKVNDMGIYFDGPNEHLKPYGEQGVKADG